MRRGLREAARDQVADPVGEHGHEHRDGYGEREKRQGVRAHLPSEAAGGHSPRQVRHDDHAEGLCREHQHEVDAVRREKAVGLRRAAEFVRQQGARAGRRECEDDLREPRE